MEQAKQLLGHTPPEWATVFESFPPKRWFATESVVLERVAGLAVFLRGVLQLLDSGGEEDDEGGPTEEERIRSMCARPNRVLVCMARTLNATG